MRFVKFQDMNGHEIQVSISGSGDYRIYQSQVEDILNCILLNKCQANILINALKDLIEATEE